MPNDIQNTPNPSGLSLFHTMYVIGLAFGLQTISVALYDALQKMAHSKIPVSTAVVDGILFAAILLMIVRFFWSTGNIKRAWTQTPPEKQRRLEQRIVLYHLPALLIQGILILFICLAYETYAKSGSGESNLIGWMLLTTAWNAGWLIFIARGQSNVPHERFWIRNNLTLVALGAILLTNSYCGTVSETHALVLFAIISIASSLMDLFKAASQYVLETS